MFQDILNHFKMFQNIPKHFRYRKVYGMYFVLNNRRLYTVKEVLNRKDAIHVHIHLCTSMHTRTCAFEGSEGLEGLEGEEGFQGVVEEVVGGGKEGMEGIVEGVSRRS